MIANRTGGLAVADHREVIQVSLEIEADSDPIAGVIRLSNRTAVPFVGWLTLSAALERVRRAEERRGRIPDMTIARLQLTPTERKIVSLLCEGLTNPQIAQRLTVSARTVQGHLLKVFRKLGVSSRTELVARMLRAKIESATEKDGEG